MVVMEKRPELKVRSGYEAELRVERTEISFHDLAGDKVQIQVTVRNIGTDCSPPTPMTLESAPLGAFVPWQPLTQLLVPALEPGESRELIADVARSRVTPLGDFNRVPPKRLLTAVNSPDQPSPQPGTGLGAILNLLRRGQTARSSGRGLAGRPSLAPDLWDLLGRGQPHWAGNINVFVGTRPVERHLAGLDIRSERRARSDAPYYEGCQLKREICYYTVATWPDGRAGEVRVTTDLHRVVRAPKISKSSQA